LLSAVQLRAVSLGYLDLFGETLKTDEEMKNLARKAGFAFTHSRWTGAQCGSTSV